MFTEVDEGCGLVKTTWHQVRKRVSKVDPALAKIIDSLDPKDLPLYLAYYPYGQTVGDAKSSFIPACDGNFYRLSDPLIHADIQKNLGYGKFDSPLGIALEKSFELFIDLKEQNLTIPHTLYKPGDIFSFLSNMSKRTEVNYSTNSVYTLAAGARSVFMLPNIECATHHANLQRDFNIKIPVAKSLYQHGEVFREIASSPVVNCDWRGCILFFSESWVKKLHESKNWAPLKLYLHEKAWKHFLHTFSYSHYAAAFSLFQQKMGLRADPYLVDTVQHLLKIAMGSDLAYAPCASEDQLPLTVLQKIFAESYQLTKYFPTIIAPTYFIFEETPLPCYYSLNYPSVFIFSKKARQVSSTLYGLRSIFHIMNQYIKEFKNDDVMCSDSRLNNITKKLELHYYHNEPDPHKIIEPSKNILMRDARFEETKSFINSEAKFSSDARFVRGCISLSNGKIN